MNRYNIEMKITTPEGETITINIDTSCPDCQTALQHFVNVENKREKRDINIISDRIPLMMIVDPDYNNTVHFESIEMTLKNYRELSNLTYNERARKYAKEILMSYKRDDKKVTFVKMLRNQFSKGENTSYISLREAVDIYDSL